MSRVPIAERTNEELAVMIQQGQTELYAELWEQVKRFFYRQAMKYYNGHKEKCTAAGIELDDVEQAAFLALADAVRAYKPEQGFTLLSYAGLNLKNRFRELYGIRSVGRVTPLNECRSLDEPLPGTEDIFLGDTIFDESAEIDFDNATDRAYSEKLHEALDSALDTLDERSEKVIRQRYYEGKTLRLVAKDMSISAESVRQIEVKAFHKLRQGKNTKMLSGFCDDVLARYAWHGTGLNAFKNTGASSVERAMEYADRLFGREDTDRYADFLKDYQFICAHDYGRRDGRRRTRLQ